MVLQEASEADLLGCSKTLICAQFMLREWSLCPQTFNLLDAVEEKELELKLS